MTVFLYTLKRIFKTPYAYGLLLLFPIIFATLASVEADGEGNDAVYAVEIDMFFGVVDNDNSALSKTLITQLETRFNTKSIEESNITAALIDQAVPWILLIPNGYGDAILANEKPELDGYSLTISDVSEIGAATAESITRSLMLLKTDDEAILEKWSTASELEINVITSTDNWRMVTFWFGFFGFVAMLTSFFIARALVDDKRFGMPDRLGILPLSPRKFLINSALALFAATQITVILLVIVVLAIIGTVPNVLLLFLILSLYNLFAVSLSIAIISLSKSYGLGGVVLSIVATIFPMIGGAFWPLELVPPFMQKLAWFSPNYWLGHGIGGLQEVTFDGYGMSVLFLLGFTVVAILLGSWKSIQRLEDV